MNKTLRKLIMSIVAVMLTGFVFTAVTFAWFYSNQNVDSDNNNMSLYFDDTTASYQVYRYDTKLLQGTTNDADGNPLDITDIDLNQYDLVFKARNRYTPIFARVEVVRLESMPENGTIYLTITRNSNGDDETHSGEDLVMGAFASSVMRFTGWVSSSFNDDPDALYQTIDNELYTTVVINKDYTSNSKLDSDVFTTSSGEEGAKTYTKVNTITLEMSYSSSDWTRNDEGKQVLNTYLYISYDVDLISHYAKENDMSSLQIGEETVSFENDINLLRVSYAK